MGSGLGSGLGRLGLGIRLGLARLVLDRLGNVVTGRQMGLRAVVESVAHGVLGLRIQDGPCRQGHHAHRPVVPRQVILIAAIAGIALKGQARACVLLPVHGIRLVVPPDTNHRCPRRARQIGPTRAGRNHRCPRRARQIGPTRAGRLQGRLLLAALVPVSILPVSILTFSNEHEPALVAHVTCPRG